MLSKPTNYPLSTAQKKIWFHQILHPGVPLYNIGISFQIDGAIDQVLFEQAINQVVKENDALRTILKEKQGQLPLQTFTEKVDIKLIFHDFSTRPSPVQHAHVWMQQELSRPFPMLNSLLCRFSLLKVSIQAYYLLIKCHHLIIDGWSIALVAQRVSARYNTLITDQINERIQQYSYVDFIEAERAYLDSPRFTQDLRYWQEKFHTLPEPMVSQNTIQFTDQLIKVQRSVLVLKHHFYAQLVKFAEDHKVSLFHVFLGVLYCYFVRAFQREDFAIGLAILNRKTANFKQTVGLFASVIPAWFCLGTHFSFTHLIQVIHKELQKDYRHQRCPLSEMKQHADVHQQNHPPLFDIILSYAKHDYDVDFNGIPIRANYLSNGFGHSALDIFIQEFHQDDDVMIYFDYNIELFDSEEIDRLKLRVKFLLEEILRTPDQSVQTLQMMPESERRELLVNFNNTAIDYPRQTIIDLFEQHTEENPEHIALIFEKQSLTYQALNQQANQLAHYLQNLGVQPETLVGLCVERSLEMIIGLLGIMKAGAAYVPLDPHYPQATLAFMLSDAKVPVLLTQEKLLNHLPPHQAQVFCLDRDWNKVANMSEEKPKPSARAEQLAYVIYTSGSTGQPKGVLIEHQGLYNLARTQIELFNVQSNSRILQFASLSFDASVSEIAMALGAGALLCLGKSEDLLPGQPLTQLLRRHAISHITLAPTALSMLETKNLLNLQHIIVAGESCPPEIVAHWSRGRKFFNGYGPTETTVCATVFEHHAPQVYNRFPIGRPIANTQVYILDAHLQLLPRGVPGELYIGGIGLARGYLNRPELTAEKFIPNPYSTDPGSRLYKTGDLARFLPDDHLEYLGRIDNQVKIRGFRIELCAVESVLRQHDNVREVAVIAQKERYGGKRLVAYIVSPFALDRVACQVDCLVKFGQTILTLQTSDISHDGLLLTQVSETFDQGTLLHVYPQFPELKEIEWLSGKVAWSHGGQVSLQLQLSSEERQILNKVFNRIVQEQGLFKTIQRSVARGLRTDLKMKLPDYMIPSAFIILDSLPLTPNGKIDRRALEQYTHPIQSSSNAEEKDSPQSPDEKHLVDIWTEVLNIKPIGIHDNFFDLGGHSLLATQIISRIREIFAVDLPLHDLFEQPTIAELAQVIARQKTSVPNAKKNGLDLNAEVILDGDIQPMGILDESSIHSPRTIFMTGATGFLGSYLLYELLTQTHAEVHCLVRAHDIEKGHQRLCDTLSSHKLWHDSFHSRIVPVLGELTKPLLGMSVTQFQKLTQCIEVIFHNGAQVNHVYPYAALKAANVLSTVEVLKLASQNRVKLLHFISTIGLLFSKHASDNEVLRRESDVLEADQLISNGYTQTKWVAEKLIMQAKARGLPGVIYRPARIVGHSQTGVSNHEDFLVLLMKGCLQLKKIPQLDELKDNMTPVDYVARTIIHLARQPESVGKVFHVVNPHATPLSLLLNQLDHLEGPLEQVSYEQWLSELADHPKNILYPLLTGLHRQPLSEKKQPVWPQWFDAQNTLNGLMGTNFVCPIVDEKLLGIYLAYFKKINLLSSLMENTA